MPDEVGREVRRVLDAIAAVEAIPDEEDRVRAKSQLMAAQVQRNREWSEERERVIRRLRDEEQLSYRKIAERLGIKLSTVQDVFREFRGSGTRRPRSRSEGENA